MQCMFDGYQQLFSRDLEGMQEAAMAEWLMALDLKSNGIFPRRFEPYSQRYINNFVFFLTLRK